MAIEARIVVYAGSEEAAQRAAAAGFARLDALDAAFSDYRPDSELMRLCASAGSGPVAVSADLLSVLGEAQALAAASGGVFDVTCGPAVALWRQARRTAVLPAANNIADAWTHMGWRKLKLDAVAGTAELLQPGMRLDLGGIGKGWALDAALAAVAAAGAPIAMIEMGGDLVAGDPPPGEPGWRVAAGCGEGGAPPQDFVLSHAALATSGDSSQSVEIGGVHYSHVIDARTGQALVNHLCCTVVADRAALSDGLATAGRILGEGAGHLLAWRLGARRVVFENPDFRPLFDGATLDGWVTRGGHYDGDALWSVEDGCITGRPGPDNAGGLLYTSRPYSSFDLQLDARLDVPFDSGIFLRMAPEGRGAQVTLDDRDDGEIGAIYSDAFLQHNANARSQRRPGDWNHFEVLCTGFDMDITVWMNGELITQYAVPEGTAGFAPRGLIGLQVHGSREDPPGNTVQFRDVRIRELPLLGDAAVVVRPPIGRPSPMRYPWEDLLENGSLSLWEAVDGEGPPRAPDDYAITDGVLAIPAAQPGGILRTKADYRDFELTLDFKLARMANGGVFLRADRAGGNPAYSGCEIQLLDDFDWEAVTGTTLQPWQFTGSLYGAVPPGARDALRPIGEWNTLEVLYQGNRLATALNGLVLYDVDTSTLAADPPFAQRAATGFLGLQRYASPETAGDTAMWIRNLRLRRIYVPPTLPPAPAVPTLPVPAPPDKPPGHQK